MKKLILLLLLLPCVAHAQFPMVAAWQGGAGYTFKPSDVDSLRLWYYADTTKTLLSKAFGDTTYIALDLVGGNNLFQLTAASKPILSDSTTVWGQVGATLNFDGVNDILVNTAIAPLDTADGITLFIVARYKALLSYDGLYAMRVEGTSVIHALAKTDGNYKDVYIGWNTGNAAFGARFTQSKPPTTTHVLTSQITGARPTEHALRQDSTTLVRGAHTGEGVVAGYALGAYTSALFPSRAHVMEVIVYGRDLNITEVRKVEEYLKRKYSL